jgi:hypothetical protein
MAIEERRKVKSTQVGLATLPTGVVTTAYRAIVEIECAACKQPIQPGDVFSRQAPHKGALHVAPTCMRCRPLCLRDADAGQ